MHMQHTLVLLFLITHIYRHIVKATQIQIQIQIVHSQNF